MKQTPNYGFPLLENGDKYTKEYQNDTFTTIDREIKAVTDKVNMLDCVEGSILETTDRVDKLENETIPDVKSQLEHIEQKKANITDVNSKVWSMANMGQDVKLAMTGGSVAVIDEDMVLEPNIVNGQVNINKFDNNLKNLFIKQKKQALCNWIIGKDVRSNGVEVANDGFMYCALDICKGDTITLTNYLNTVGSIIPTCYIYVSGTMYDIFKPSSTTSTGKIYTFTATKSGKLYINQAILNSVQRFQVVAVNDEVKINPNKKYTDYAIATDIILKNVGKILDANGELIPHADDDGWCTSDFIEINSSLNLKAYGFSTYPACCIYDKNKKILSLVNVETNVVGSIGTVEKTINEIEGAYIRVSSHKHSSASFNHIANVVSKKSVEDYLSEQLQTLNKLKNKKCFIFGDSISDETQATTPSQIYATYLRNNYEMNVNSYACYGTGYGFNASWNPTNSGVNNICRRIDDAPSDVIDYCILAGGTNDWDFAVGGALALGVFEDCIEGNSNNTFANRVGLAIRKIWAKYPKCKILIITPLPRFGGVWNNTDVTNSTPLTTNHAGKTLSEYRDMLVKIANYYSIPVLDMSYNSNIQYKNFDYLGDGLHPTPYYAIKYADIIAEKIKTI